MSTDTADERFDVSFASGAEECGAWLYLPDGASAERPVPVIVMAHGLGAVKALGLDAFAERFRNAGYACLVFDYRHFGGSSGEPRELLAIDRQLEDWRAAVAFARCLPECDADRVILWGTSFAGGHVTITAADDPRIAAAIAQNPFTDGRASAMTLNVKSLARVTALALRDLAARWLGAAPVRVACVAQPGEAGLMTAADAMRGYEAVAEASDLDPSATMVPARIALQIIRHVPGRRAKDVRCPILFAVCEADSVAPPRAAVSWATTAPKGEIRRYDTGHFEIYLGDWFARVIADQIDFLRAHVPVQAD